MGICGKCSFEDYVEFHSEGIDHFITTTDVYLSGNGMVPLRIKSKKDLVCYYPYLISWSTHSDGCGKIMLLDRSYIDQEEEEHIGWELDSLKKYWRKCKRKKIPFDKNEALSRIVWPTDDEPQPYEIELVNRVAELGEAATGENIHDSMHDRMRKEWYDLMIESGWDEKRAYIWVYGWRRFLERNKDDNNSTSRFNI